MAPTPLLVVALTGASLVIAACGADSTGDVAATSTTTVLGSVVDEVVECADGIAQTLMPVGVDPHDFAPSSRQVAEIGGSDLVVANGLNLEEGLTDALSAAAADGTQILQVAEQVDPIPFADSEGLDPHFWLDTGRMAEAAQVIGSELAAVTENPAYQACGEDVATELTATDDEVRSILASIPVERRVLVTDHDSFGYFAEAYDFDVVGVVVPGGSTLAQPSSAELADLVAAIEDADVPAIFTDVAEPDALAQAVAAEVGSDVAVVDLFVGSVGPDGSGAETYPDMVTTNAQRIADALG